MSRVPQVRPGKPSTQVRHGAVATSQPDAARAGLDVLRSGGNAVDAAIAAAAALTVVEPCSNGLGSDAFALVWDGDRLHGLNGSGRAPAALSAETLRDSGHKAVPLAGWEAVTVPGAVAAWRDLHARFGRLPFAEVLAPAITLAAEGFTLTPVVAWGWAGGVAEHAHLTGAEFDEFSRVFAPDGAPPRAGETVRLPDHAATLSAIAESSGDAFYAGELADRLVAFASRTGGYLKEADLLGHTSQWVEPISAQFRDHTVWEIPPSGQGIAALAALTILDGFDPVDIDPATPDGAHRAIEAVKLALTDAHRYVADPDLVDVPVEGLLSVRYAAERRAAIGQRAADPAPGIPPGSETVYLAAVDADGQMVSLIQSNFHGFGSHIVVPGTGIALQNRGHGFSLDPAHPNVLAPGKRPFHTIIPGFLTRATTMPHGGPAVPVGPFGVMGGHMQAQGHVQLMLATIDAGLDPQAALDRPRWHWTASRELMIENAPWPRSAAAEMLTAFRARGHDAALAPNAAVFGRGQAIWRTGDDYLAGSESRADGEVASY